MSKQQKIGLALLAVLVTLIVCIFTWKSCSHEPAVQTDNQDQIDSLNLLKDLAKANATSNGNKADSVNKLNEKGLKNFNNPIGSDERESLRTRIKTDSEKDSIRRSGIR